jgi:hypothetical protein
VIFAGAEASDLGGSRRSSRAAGRGGEGDELGEIGQQQDGGDGMAQPGQMPASLAFTAAAAALAPPQPTWKS